jgi:putative transcriptional regulator
MDDNPVTLKGQFLISMPGLMDPNFHQTITLICEHNADGAFGLVINRVHPHLQCAEIFKELGIDYVAASATLSVHLGGPVHMGEIFVLHGAPFQWEASLAVTPSVVMSNTKDILEAVASGRGPRDFILTLGCAGWGPGQLEGELRENAWLTCPAQDEIIFGWPVADRWEETVRRMGIDPALLSNVAGNA